MAGSRMVYIPGILKWAKLSKPDPKFDVYTVDVYPDAEGWKEFDEAGLQLKRREDEDGDEFIKVRRAVSKKYKDKIVELGAPDVVIQNADDPEVYDAFDGLIGNGSTGMVKLRVYDTDRGKGHELVAVAITELVEYEGIEGDGKFAF